MFLLKALEKTPYVVLLFLVAAISISTLAGDFLFIDDISLIVSNPYLTFSPSHLLAITIKPLGQIYDASDSPLKYIYYRPALDFLYMLNSSIWGINPVGFHVTNLLLHLATAITVFRSGLILLDDNRLAALLAAAIFAVHPVHNELIGRVAMNENLLGFFMILSFYLFLKNRLCLSLILFALAMLTKESAVMLLLVILLFALRINTLKEAVSSLKPYAAVMAGYFIVRLIVVGLPGTYGFDTDLPTFILTSCAAMAAYLKLLLFPHPLKIFYPVFKPESFLQADVLLAVAVCLLLICLLYRFRTDRLLTALLMSTVVLLAPVVYKANMLILGLDRAFIAERQLYVPSMFFVLFSAVLILKHTTAPSGRFALAAVLLIIPTFIYASRTSAAVWQNSDSVYSVFMRDFPESSVARNQKGVILLQQGDLDQAMAEFTAALPAKKVEPSGQKPVKTGYKGYKFIGLGNFIDKYDIAAYQTQYAEIHYNIGLVYLKKKDPESAAKKFRTALVLKPHFTDARTALADIYLKRKKFKEASREYQLALKDINDLKER